MVEAPSQAELEAAHCWEPEDRVPKRPMMTEFRRASRYHQAKWRQAHAHPIGTQPIVPKSGQAMRLVGSRMPLEYARETGANFLTVAALEAARARTSITERHQSFDHQRLWAELLSSPAMCCNLFGDLVADLDLANRAVHAWWPDTPGTVCDVRVEHSPGRLDPAWLGNLCAFSIAFVLDLGDGRQGIVGITTAYHDRSYRQPPKPTRLPRYIQIMDRSGVFEPGAIDAVNGTDLIHIWLDHMLVHSMLQHPSNAWGWGRHVVVHPAGNSDFVDACGRYRDLLEDESSFASITIEQLLDSGALPRKTAAAVRERYIVG